MIWYQYIFLVSAVILYSLSQLHIFGQLKWQNDPLDSGFFGQNSWVRKYAVKNNGALIEPKEPRYFGSTTFLVWTTDFYHFAQMLMKICFSIAIAGITWWAVLAFTLWTGIQWGVFKIASK